LRALTDVLTVSFVCMHGVCVYVCACVYVCL